MDTQHDPATADWLARQQADRNLDVPAFLRREPSTSASVDYQRPVVSTERMKARAQAEREALAVVEAIRAGADTLGKIRRACPQLSEEQLTAAVKVAPKFGRIKRTGKRYTVIQ